jgi:hypothetical protein
MENGTGSTEVQLQDLRGIGKKMLEDFQLLGITSVRQLKTQNARALYDRMCKITATKQDPCVLDTYRCAIEQARDPNLPEEQKDWWYWSRIRKAAARLNQGASARPARAAPRRQASER